MGNSEVGHLNIGAGRVVMQDLPRIGEADQGRQPGAATRRITGLIETLHAYRRRLPSDGAGLARRRAFASGSRRRAGADPGRRAGSRSRVHAFTDGRDTPPQSGAEDLAAAASGAARRRADRHGLRPLLRDGPRQPLGAGREGLPRHRRRHAATASPTRPSAMDHAYARGRHRRVRHARRHRRLCAACRTATRMLCFNFRADRVREILARAARSRLRRLRPPAHARSSPPPSA